MVYLPMAYVYGARFVHPNNPLLDEIREELYGKGVYETIDWPKHQFRTCSLDAYQPLG